MGAREGMHGRSLVTFAGVGGVLGGWALGAVVCRFSLRTGVSDEEAFGSLPGDGIIPHPMVEWTRGITVHSEPDRIWPWLAQMGCGGGGWYTPGMGRSSGQPVDIRTADVFPVGANSCPQGLAACSHATMRNVPADHGRRPHRRRHDADLGRVLGVKISNTSSAIRRAPPTSETRPPPPLRSSPSSAYDARDFRRGL